MCTEEGKRGEALHTLRVWTILFMRLEHIAAEPTVSVYFRIAVFSVSVLHDERIVVVAEQRPDASEEDSFQWMSRVLQVPDLLQFTLVHFNGFQRLFLSWLTSSFLPLFSTFPGHRQHSPGRCVLSGSGSCQHASKGSPGGHSYI